MDKHITVLGALFIAVGIMGLIGMIVVLIIFTAGTAIIGTVTAQDPEAPQFIALLPAGFGLLIVLAIGISAIPSIIVGYGLLVRRRWSGPFTLIVGIINIPGFPLGTITGIYAIWVFLQDETRELLVT